MFWGIVVVVVVVVFLLLFTFISSTRLDSLSNLKKCVQTSSVWVVSMCTYDATLTDISCKDSPIDPSELMKVTPQIVPCYTSEINVPSFQQNRNRTMCAEVILLNTPDNWSTPQQVFWRWQTITLRQSLSVGAKGGLERGEKRSVLRSSHKCFFIRKKKHIHIHNVIVGLWHDNMESSWVGTRWSGTVTNLGATFTTLAAQLVNLRLGDVSALLGFVQLVLQLAKLAQVSIGLFVLLKSEMYTHSCQWLRNTWRRNTSHGSTHSLLGNPLVGFNFQLELVDQILKSSQVFTVLFSLGKTVTKVPKWCALKPFWRAALVTGSVPDRSALWCDAHIYGRPSPRRCFSSAPFPLRFPALSPGRWQHLKYYTALHDG